MDDESPLHDVLLDTFWIAKHETTNAQYKAFIDAGNDEYIPRIDCNIWNGDGTYDEALADHPVVCVSWTDALAYGEWLAAESGFEVTLPSEAEWEKAARGDQDSRIYPWGDDFDGALLNYIWTDLPTNTAEVGSYPGGASPYGVEDMAGNVYEWTRSLWGTDLWNAEYLYPYTDRRAERENLEAGDDVTRVMRSGSWSWNSLNVRISFRNREKPAFWNDTIGFRVVVLGPPSQ